MERRFPRAIDSLESIFAFVREFFAGAGIGEDHAFDVDLILEELFTNMVKYARGGEPEITIGLESRDGRVIIRLVDRDVEPFDVTQAPEPDLDAPLEERPIGGLGLHLVRQMAENLTYDYRDRTSTITVVKRLEEQDV